MDNNKEIPIISLPVADPTTEDFIMFTDADGKTKRATFDQFQDTISSDLDAKIAQVDAALAQSYELLDQAQEVLDESMLNGGDYYPRGFYNATTNQANGTTPLTANSSAWNTGNPGDKQARIEITVPGPAAFAGANFAAGATLGSGYLATTADNKWIYVPSDVADLAVTINKLGNDVKSKNLPWMPTATNSYGNEVRAAIKDIWLYNVDKTKEYFVGIFGKKPLGGSQFIIQVYRFDNPGNTLVLNMAISGYVPASTPDIIRIQGTGSFSNVFAIVTVDWSVVADGTYKINMTTSHAGISPFRYMTQDDNLPYLNRKLEAQPETKSSVQKNIISRTDTLVIQNTAALTVPHANISALILSFASQNLEFDTFSFPGHNFNNANAVYAFCLIRTTSGAPMMHLQYFDKRTDDYVFLINRMVNLTEGVTVTMGYLSASGQSFAPGTNITWASSPADANLATATVRYLNLVSDPFSNGLVAGAGWSSTKYKLSKSTNVLMSPKQRTQAEMKFVLPSKLYPLTDSQLWIYANGIIKYDHLYRAPENGLRLTGKLVSNGAAVTNFSMDDEIGRMFGTSPAANVTFEILDRRNINDVTTQSDRPTVIASKVVNVTPKARPTGRTWNIIVIGDSFEDLTHEGVGMIQKLVDFGAVHSNVINSRGVRTTAYGRPSESRASWTEGTFFRYVPVALRADVNAHGTDLLHSPFMFSPDDTQASAYFSFSEYMTTYGGAYGTIHAVVFALGTNPYSPAGSKINEMIASVRTYSATLPVVVCTVPPASISRRNIDTPMDQARKMEQTEAYLTLFDNRDAEFIYLCPWHMCVHRLYGLQNTVGNIAKFADQNRVNPQLYDVPANTLSNAYRQQQTELYLSDIHPSAQGIFTYADALYDTLCYVLA